MRVTGAGKFRARGSGCNGFDTNMCVRISRYTCTLLGHHDVLLKQSNHQAYIRIAYRVEVHQDIITPEESPEYPTVILNMCAFSVSPSDEDPYTIASE